MVNLKERFLNSLIGYSEGTIKNYRYIISGKIAQEAESDYGKDICQFSYEECIDLLKRYSNRSIDMIAVNKSALESYIDFAIMEGFVPTRINYFKGLQKNDLKNYVNLHAADRKYLTLDELVELENLCNNAQDSVVYRLIFLGIRGNECEELLNLKVKDVYEDHIELPDRSIKIDYYTYALIQEAINQSIYLKGNGETSEKARSDKLTINGSEYVLRPAGATKFGQLEYQTLRARVTRVKNFYGNPYLNIRNIWFSGIINAAKLIKEEKGEVTLDDYKQIHKQFGYNEIYAFKTMAEVQEYL